MTAAASVDSTVRCVGVFGGEVDDGQVDLAAKAIKHRSGYRSLAGGEDHQGFGQRGGTDEVTGRPTAPRRPVPRTIVPEWRISAEESTITAQKSVSGS